MKEGLLEQIQNVGHWRVNFRPAKLPERRLKLPECLAAVEQSAVSIRGWDFPHVSRGGNESGGFDRTTDYVENWTEWSGMLEFWRMYRSTQFLSYIALREDTRHEANLPILNFVGAVYSITEFFEFAHRLHKHGLYIDGVTVHVSLVGANGRHLVAGQGRIPFFENYVTREDKLEFREFLDPTALQLTHREVAVDVCLELFNVLGWNPDRTQIAAEQERFYKRNFAY